MQTSPFGPLIGRAFELLARKELGIATSMDDMTYPEYRAVTIAFEEQRQHQDEKTREMEANIRRG